MMTFEAWYTLAILIIAVILFITEWLRVDVVALGVVVALMLGGTLSTAEALSGFSNSAVLTIAALFIVGGGVMQTGLAGMIGRRVLRVAGTGELRLMVVLMIAVALMSSFMSDTGTVAVLLPAVIILARSAKIAPSRLLIPLAYGSLLGGATTLIGTPPNIIVSDLLRENGLTPFSFFSYTPVGLVLLILGIGYMVVAGRRLLPDRRVKVETQAFKTPEELVNLYRLPDNLFRLRVRRASDLVGQTLAASELRQQYGVTVLDILRREEPRPVLQLVRGRQGNGQRPLPARVSVPPMPDTVIELDDILIVQGEADAITQMAAKWNLGVQPASDGEDASVLLNEEVGVAEVLIPPRSNLIGKTLVESRFGSTYKLTVLGLTGPGSKGKLDVKSTPIRFGDILLVQGPWKHIAELRNHRRDFVVMGQPEEMLSSVPNRAKAMIALVILLAMIGTLVGEWLPIATTSLIAALLMVLTGCLTMDDAYRAIDWKSIVLVAGMLPMSTALQRVGLVDMAAQGLVSSLGQISPLALLAGLFLLTSLFTQVLSNTATTVVLAPVALAAATGLGVTPHAFLMAVAVAASMAFVTPVASPVNTLVMGAGDYRFVDFMKVGIPLVFITLLGVVLVLPLVFPF